MKTAIFLAVSGLVLLSCAATAHIVTAGKRLALNAAQEQVQDQRDRAVIVAHARWEEELAFQESRLAR